MLESDIKHQIKNISFYIEKGKKAILKKGQKLFVKLELLNLAFYILKMSIMFHEQQIS